MKAVHTPGLANGLFDDDRPEPLPGQFEVTTDPKSGQRRFWFVCPGPCKAPGVLALRPVVDGSAPVMGVRRQRSGAHAAPFHQPRRVLARLAPRRRVHIMLKTIAILAACAALAACASAPADPSKLTEGQLRALAADRSAVASCATTMTPWGPIRTTLVQLDRATIPAGTVTVGSDCTVTITSEALPPRRAASAP